jgi:hypothetical protein
MSSIRKVDYSMEKIPDSGNAAHQVIHEGQLIVDRTTQNRRSGFLQRFFPDPRQRVLVEAEVGIIRSELDFRRRTLEKVREAQSQSLTERLNEYLVREKGKIRAETAAFLLSKRNELQQQMDRVFDDFTENMEIKLEKVEAMSNSKLRQVRMDQLERDIDGFMYLQQELMEQFQNIISENV